MAACIIKAHSTIMHSAPHYQGKSIAWNPEIEAMWYRGTVIRKTNGTFDSILVISVILKVII